MKCAMWNVKCGMRKAGVSLITVLLFMLVATIAATATYKWITSEGHSSASRMMEREAYQSAIAGIESARSWMTYHANDVGALIKQYKEDGSKPIKLDGQLAEFMRAGQTFHVWLTGVNTENSTYKLKIVSQGLARDGGATHSEVAILDVNGLYQVKIPSVKYTGEAIFNEAFFGSAKNGISLEVNSAIFNGDTKFNTKFNASDYVIVTGDVNVNSSTTVGNLYVKGNLYSCTNFNVTGDAYVEQKMYINGTHSYGGDIYAKGGMDLSGTGTGDAQCSTGPGGGITVNGNVSSEANLKMPRHNAATKYNFSGNLVLKNGAKVDFPTLSEFTWGAAGGLPYEVHFGGNIYLDGGFSNGWFMGYARAAQVSFSSAGKTFYSSTPMYRVSDENQNVVYSWWKKANNEHQDTDISGDADGLYAIDKDGKSYTLTAVPQNTYCNKSNCQPTDDFSDTYFWDNAHFYCPSWVEKGYWDGPNWITYNEPSGCGNCSWYLQKAGVGDRNGYRWKCDTKGKQTSRNEIFVQINGTYSVSKPDTTGWGANRMQDYENKITNENTGTGCGTTNHVKDPIQFNKSLLTHNLMHTKDKPMECSDTDLGAGGSFWNAWPHDPDAWSQLSTCYQKAKAANHLYDNQWLLINVGKADWATQSSHYLQGNFIIVVEGVDLASGLYLPQTRAQADGSPSHVILYFPNGYSKTLNSSATSGPMNYFVFSDGDLKNVQLGGIKINGSVFLTDCHNMGSDQTIKIEYNKELVTALTGSGVICSNNGTNKCSPSAGSSSSAASSASSETISFGGTDKYYISTAPQLSITLESQYANNESIENIASTGENTKGSFVVLPRVLYLPTDPPGKLEHYYNVIPLNSKQTVESQSITCEGGIPTSGKLYDGTAHLVEGYYTCSVTGTVSGVSSTVPFYVVVRGSDGVTPKVTFVTDAVELPKEEATTVQLTVPNTTGASQTFKVKVARTGTETGWTVTPINPIGTCEANSECTFQVSTAGPPTDIFTITNNSVNSGMLTFQILDCIEGGCNVGIPNIELVYMFSSVTVKRKSLAEWCAENGDDADATKCAKKNHPDCTISDEWIQANGSNCSANPTNDTWNCDITDNISLSLVNSNIPDGCEAVIPGENLLEAPFANKSTRYLYASLKAKKQVFHTGFKLPSDINPGQTIHILAEHNGAADEEKDCSYSNFTSETDGVREEHCNIDVYYGSRVTLSLENASDRTNFNYWLCFPGVDCPSEKIPVNTYTYPISITGENTVYAHYNEKDKHCFFDEFKDKNTHTNRATIACGTEKEYCIDVCSGTCSDAITTNSGNSGKPDAKWRLIDGDLSNIEYSGDGKISLKTNTTRGHKENSKGSATIMSSVQAGIYGTLKAQFQVPREGVNESDEAKSTIKKSGFMLRSNTNGDSYLMLNIFSDKSGYLKARICLNGGNTCQEKRIGSAYVKEGSIITISAVLRKIDPGDGTYKDVLEIQAYTNAFSSDYESTTFDLTNSELNGVEDLGNQDHEYLGMKLSDQNFKIYGIGWKSDDYVSECWDLYPTVSCSFKAAYAGGIVPQTTGTGLLSKPVKPWVGLSSWFENAGGCTPVYYYRGNDAGCYGSVAGTNDYKECTNNYYEFTTSGPHGATADGDKTAKAGVSGCSVYGEAAAWANSAATAHCGAFWVGEYKNCTQNVTFGYTVSNGDDGSYYALDANGAGSVNLRDANLVVTLDNPNGAEISVYLFSKNSEDGYTYGSSPVYSQPYTTTKQGNNFSFSIAVSDISTAEGFDPEHVVGVYIKTDDASVNIRTVQSSCDHVLKIVGCSASWDGVSRRFNISANVKNYSDAGSFTVTEKNSNIAGSIAKDCKNNECSWSGNNAVFEWSYNAFDDVVSETSGYKDYYFVIDMKDKEGGDTEDSPCTTAAVRVSKISATCGVNTNSIERGAGLPVFTYSISGCPSDNTGCPYEIKLQDIDQQLISASSGNFNGKTTDPEAANTSGNPLDAGTYKFVMKSTNANQPFADCEEEFTVTIPSSSSVESSSSSAPPSSSSAAPSSSSFVATATCAFDKIKNNQNYEWFQALDKIKIDNPNSKDFHGLAWKTTWKRAGQTAESDISSGTLNCNNNSICEIPINSGNNSGLAQPGTWYVYLGSSTTPSCLMTLADGSGLPTMQVTGSCRLENDCCKNSSGDFELAVGQKKRFDVTSLTKCNSSKCDWFLKKDELKIANGTYGDNIYYNDIEGPGTYTLHLLSETASAACTVVVGEKSPAEGCRHANTTRSYGDKSQFQAKLIIAKDKSYRVLGPNNEEIVTGTFTQAYNNNDWNVEFYSKISGKYKLEVNGSIACETSNSLTVSAAYMSNCSLAQTTISSGGSTTFRYKINNCKNSQCDYEIKRSGVSFKTETGKGENDYSVTVNEGGEYVVWLNGVETNCKATLTVSGGGGASSSSAAPASSSTAASSSSAAASFPCNDGNSTQMYPHNPAEDVQMAANSCVKYSAGSSGNLQIGCWWAPETPVTVNIKKCDGTTTTMSHSCGGWQGVDVGNNCTVYAYPEKTIKWDLNFW